MLEIAKRLHFGSGAVLRREIMRQFADIGWRPVGVTRNSMPQSPTACGAGSGDSSDPLKSNAGLHPWQSTPSH